MQQVISTQRIQLNRGLHTTRPTLATLANNLFEWCDKQEIARLKWLAIALVGGIGTILPLTLLAIVFGADNNFNLWIAACAVNVPILITGLALQPMKVTLPLLFFAWLVDAIIITCCAIAFFIN